MSKRFERIAGNVEAISIGAVIVAIAVAYLVSRFWDG
jgi:hypothetical protein